MDLQAANLQGRRGLGGRDYPDALGDELVRVAQGDASAFARVYDAYSGRLTAAILSILKHRAETDEVLHDVFITVWLRAGSYDPQRGTAAAWLCVIARRRAIDMLRSHAKGAEARFKGVESPFAAGFDTPDHSPSALQMIEARQDQDRLAGYLDGIDEQTAKAIRLAFVEGLPYEELAKRLDTPLGTIKSRIRRGLLKLRRMAELDAPQFNPVLQTVPSMRLQST